MPHKEVRDLEIPKEIETKIQRREKKKKPKMKVSGKRVFQLKKIIHLVKSPINRGSRNAGNLTG